MDFMGGTDVLTLEGIAGTDEKVEVEATTSANQGMLRVLGSLDLMFANTEIVDLLANLNDADAAAFIGTDHDDELEINLAAEGTIADPRLAAVRLEESLTAAVFARLP